MAHCIIAGAESMSFIPMGYKPTPDYAVAAGNEDYYWGMGLTAEAVAQQFKFRETKMNLLSTLT
jgi:acetyl-CoA acyltransferase